MTFCLKNIKYNMRKSSLKNKKYSKINLKQDLTPIWKIQLLLLNQASIFDGWIPQLKAKLTEIALKTSRAGGITQGLNKTWWWFWPILCKETHFYSNQKQPDFHQKVTMEPNVSIKTCVVYIRVSTIWEILDYQKAVQTT